MKSLVILGIGLGIVFGLCFVALVGELYYLLWWKKRITNRDIEEQDSSNSSSSFGSSSSFREISYMLCWKGKPSLSTTTVLHQSNHQVQDVRIELNEDKEYVVKQFGDQDDMSIESELMRLHGITGPTRLLFTIKEETKEDLESDDGRPITHKSKCLKDFLMAVETPIASPLPLSPMVNSYKQQGFNPLYESSSNSEMSKIKSSPPPKFKFLIEAEEKLYRKTLVEETARRLHQHVPQYHPSNSSSQVLPLSSSPISVQYSN